MAELRNHFLHVRCSGECVPVAPRRAGWERWKNAVATVSLVAAGVVSSFCGARAASTSPVPGQPCESREFSVPDMRLYRVSGRCELREGDYLLRMEADDMPGSLGIKVNRIDRHWVEVMQVTGVFRGEQAWAVKRLSFGDTIGRDTLGINVKMRVERGESRRTAIFDISYPDSQ